MADVIADQRGYFGGTVREAGERFSVPDELWKDARRRPKWVRPATGAAPVAPATDKLGKKGRGAAAAVQPAEPFADAPAPETALKGNGVQEALGTTAPDWVDPSAPQPVSD